MELLEYWPTAAVGLVVGVITQYVVRLGKRDEVAVQQAANRLNETQQVIEALEKRIIRMTGDLEREHQWRIEADEKARELHALVVGQIHATSVTAFPPPKPTNRESLSGELSNGTHHDDHSPQRLGP